MSAKTIELGDLVTDTITGFEGIAIGHVRWLNGCDRYVIQPQKLHEGKPVESQTIDVQQLRVKKAGVIKNETQYETVAKGGPIPTPARTPKM